MAVPNYLHGTFFVTTFSHIM